MDLVDHLDVNKNTTTTTTTLRIDNSRRGEIHVLRNMGVWTPKIDTATRPFLGLSDMRQGCFLNSTGGQDCFLNSTGRQGCFLNSTGRHYLFL